DGALERATGRVGDVAALTHRRGDAPPELLGSFDFDFWVLGGRAKHSNALNATLRSDNRELLLAGKLPGLREVGVPDELVPLAEQRLDVLLRQVNVMRRHLD